MSEHDHAEAAELERAAEWRLRQVGENPDDMISADAARQLQTLAEQVRTLEGSALLHEFRCICNWLGESGDVDELVQMVRDYNGRIGAGEHPADGEAYLRGLIGLAQKTFGSM
jgi:hypothetical protein